MPLQLPLLGVTVMVDVPAPVGEKEAIFPLPEAASPVPVLLLLQLKDVVPGLPVKVTALVATPTQRVWSLGSLTDAEQQGAFTLPMVINCRPGSVQATRLFRQLVSPPTAPQRFGAAAEVRSTVGAEL